MLEEAIGSEQKISQVLVDETKIEVWQDLIAAHSQWEWIAVSPGVFKHISDTQTPSGIAALVMMNNYDWLSLLEEQKILLLLDAVTDPGNMGTIIRTAWALGIDGILLLPDCVDVYSPKVVRASMGGIFNVPLFQVNMEQVEQLCHQGYRIMAASADGDVSVYEADFSGSLLICIGNERRGINQDLQNISRIKVKIPTNPKADSLNAAVACSIIVAQAWQQRQNSGSSYLRY